MSRRRCAVSRQILPDYKYSNLTIAKMINKVMLDGKKSVAESIMYGALSVLESKVGGDVNEIFEKVIENTRPLVEVKSRRVGGATYQVPVEVRISRGLALSMKNLINAATSRKERSMQEKLGAEFVDAYNGKGAAVKKKDDTHKMAEANKAFAQYRW